jgi:hypothetical protein
LAMHKTLAKACLLAASNTHFPQGGNRSSSSEKHGQNRPR